MSSMSCISGEFIFTNKKKTKPTYFAFKIYPDCHSVWNPNFKFYRELIHLVNLVQFFESVLHLSVITLFWWINSNQIKVQAWISLLLVNCLHFKMVLFCVCKVTVCTLPDRLTYLLFKICMTSFQMSADVRRCLQMPARICADICSLLQCPIFFISPKCQQKSAAKKKKKKKVRILRKLLRASAGLLV